MIMSTKSKNEIEKKCKFSIIVNLNRMNIVGYYFFVRSLLAELNTLHCWQLRQKSIL